MRVKRFLSALFLGGLLFALEPEVQKAKAKIKEGKFDEATTDLEAAHKAKPANAEIKTALVESLMARGDFYMNNRSLPPGQKYPLALRSYRRVIALDKNRKDAAQKAAMIESIYQSMGRPVPQ